MSDHEKPSQYVSNSWKNSFTCINTVQIWSSSWPVRQIFSVQEYPPLIQTPVSVATARSNFRDSIMNRAQELERSKQVPKKIAEGSTRVRKRKSPEAAVQAVSDSEEPLLKRLKTVKPGLFNTRKHEGETSTIRKVADITISTRGLSAKTMSKLDAFRYSAQVDDFQNHVSASDTEEGDTSKAEEVQVVKPVSRSSKYVLKDHSSRLIQMGKEETAKQADAAEAEPLQIEPFDFQGDVARAGNFALNPKTGGDGIEEDVSNPQSRFRLKDHSIRLIQAGIAVVQEEAQRSAIHSDSPLERAYEDEAELGSAPSTQYKMKDHSSRLIQAGKEELAIGAKLATTIDLAESDDALASFDVLDDLDDFVFDDPDLDDAVCEQATPTNTTEMIEMTEMDDMDDSIFEQIIAADEADWQEVPPSAQAEIKCFSSDPVSSRTKPGLMLPPRLPSPTSPTKYAIKADNQRMATPSHAPISPFLRTPGTTLVTSTCNIPNLHAAGRVPTCFRIAELLREVSNSTPPLAMELFAMVTASIRSRDGASQSFTLADIFFPQRPPYVHGVYAKCAESELFDDDSRPFLKAGQGDRGILARAIVKPTTESGKQLRWNQKHRFHAGEEKSIVTQVEVLSIYVCPWDDVEYTKGIVMPDEEMQIKREGEKEELYQPEKKRKFSPLKPASQAKDAALKEISSNLPSSPTKMGGVRK